jgi:hypothetical protein
LFGQRRDSSTVFFPGVRVVGGHRGDSCQLYATHWQRRFYRHPTGWAWEVFLWDDATKGIGTGALC